MRTSARADQSARQLAHGRYSGVLLCFFFNISVDIYVDYLVNYMEILQVLSEWVLFISKECNLKCLLNGIYSLALEVITFTQQQFDSAYKLCK